MNVIASIGQALIKARHSFIAALLAIASMAPLAGCGDQRSPDEQMQAAHASYQAGQYRAALIDLKNLLIANPGQKDARLLLGLTLLELGDAPGAQKELERARDLGVSPDEYYVEMLRARLAQGQHRDVINEFELDGMMDQEKRQIARTLYAKSLLVDGQVNAAEDELQEIVSSSAGSEPLRRAYLGLTEIARFKGDLEESIALAKKSLEYDPESAESATLLGQSLLANKQFEQAREQFVRVRELTQAADKDRFTAAGGEVEAALNLGDSEEAQLAANRLFKLAPDHPVTGYLVARVAYVSGDKDAAYEYLQKVLSKNPRFQKAQALQGALSLERKELEQAEALLSSAVTAQPRDIAARKLLAETLMQLDKPEAATKILQAGIDSGFYDQKMIAMRDRASIRQNDKSTAIARLEKSLADNPDDPDVQFALASAYLANRDTGRATAIIESSKNSSGTLGGAILLLLAAIQDKDDSESRKQAESISSQWPDNSRANNLLGSWYFSTGEYDKATGFFENILAKTPGDVSALTNLGRIDIGQQNYSSARSRYINFLKTDPENEAVLLALANVYQQEGDVASAVKIAQRAYDNDPSSETPAVILSRFYRLNGDLEKSYEFARTAAAANPDSVSAQLAIGRVLQRLGRSGEALSAFTVAYELAPDDKAVLHAKAQAETGQELYSQARNTYQKIWKIDSTDLLAARQLMMLEFRANRSSAANDIMNTVRNSGLDPVVLADIEGDFHRENGDLEQAAAAYTKSYDMLPNLSVALKAHRVINASGGDASGPLLRWLATSPDDTRIRTLLAQYHAKVDNTSQAIKEYETILQQEPELPYIMNNLAWLYHESSSDATKEQALELSRRAWELQPDSSQIGDTYGWILFRSGQIAKGIEVLAEAESMAMRADSPTQFDITYHHAVALKESGERAAARARLQRILNGNQDFTNREDARKLLESL